MSQAIISIIHQLQNKEEWKQSIASALGQRYYSVRKGLLTIRDSSLKGTPHYKGLLTIRDSSLKGTPHYKGLLATRDVSL